MVKRATLLRVNGCRLNEAPRTSTAAKLASPITTVSGNSPSRACSAPSELNCDNRILPLRSVTSAHELPLNRSSTVGAAPLAATLDLTVGSAASAGVGPGSLTAPEPGPVSLVAAGVAASGTGANVGAPA